MCLWLGPLASAKWGWAWKWVQNRGLQGSASSLCTAGTFLFDYYLLDAAVSLLVSLAGALKPPRNASESVRENSDGG